MDRIPASRTVPDKNDAGMYDQLLMLHPHVWALPELDIQDLTNHRCPLASLATNFGISHQNNLILHGNGDATMTNNVVPAPAALLAIFTPHWYEQYTLRLEEVQASNHGQGGEAPAHLREHWFLDSEIWGEGTGAFRRFARSMSSQSKSSTSTQSAIEVLDESTTMNRQATPTMLTQQTIGAAEKGTATNGQVGLATSAQQTIEAPCLEQRTTATNPTRALQVRGPPEVANIEYLQWFWARNHRFQTESMKDHSKNFAVGDIEIWFKEGDEEDAQLAYEALMDPEFANGLHEPITIEYLADNSTLAGPAMGLTHAAPQALAQFLSLQNGQGGRIPRRASAGF